MTPGATAPPPISPTTTSSSTRWMRNGPSAPALAACWATPHDGHQIGNRVAAGDVQALAADRGGDLGRRATVQQQRAVEAQRGQAAAHRRSLDRAVADHQRHALSFAVERDPGAARELRL